MVEREQRMLMSRSLCMRWLEWQHAGTNTIFGEISGKLSLCSSVFVLFVGSTLSQFIHSFIHSFIRSCLLLLILQNQAATSRIANTVGKPPHKGHSLNNSLLSFVCSAFIHSFLIDINA